MSLIDKIKSDVKKAGANRGKFIYFKEGEKQRIRFLTDMDDGMEVVFHDSFEKGVNVPCQEIFGKDCDYCDDDELRTRSQYLWSVYNYETKEVQLFMFPVNSFSPVPALMAMYENYGTLTDRDYVINRQGKQTNTSYSVVPMDKAKFRNEKAKAYSESQILKMLAKAYPTDDDDDEEDEKPKKKKSKAKVDLDDAEADEIVKEQFGDDEENSYEDMSAKELFKLCKDRGIEAEPKKKEKYYINLLVEDDKASEDWDDDEDDEWEDDED